MTELSPTDNSNHRCSSGSGKIASAVALFLFLGVLALFGKCAEHDFVNIDDDIYVYNNQHVVQGLTLRGAVWALTAMHAANWHPLTWLSHMLDVQLFGLNPTGHHLMNVPLHGANAVLLFLLLLRMTGALWRSAIVTALFAFHPLHVESVAWVAERKDLLSTFLAFMTMHCYVSYSWSGQKKWYVSAFICYLLGLMAKPMLVTLPLLLLLLDYWPLGRLDPACGAPLLTRLRALLQEKLPFLAAMTCSALITIHAQDKGGAIVALADTSLAARIANALVSYQQYLIQTVWPANLAVFYPFPKEMQLGLTLLALVTLSLVTWATVRCRHERPWLQTGWLWYICSLLPVIGLIEVGSQAMADRYTYLPLIGIFIIVVWTGDELLPHRFYCRQAIVIVAGAVCGLLTWQQLGYWQNSITLNKRAISVTSGNFIAENNLGLALDKEGQHDEALKHFDEAVRIDPMFAKAYVNKAETMRKTGRIEEGLSLVKTALQIQPGFNHALDEKGSLLLQSGRPSEAYNVYREILKKDPDSADILRKLGIAASQMGKRTAALGYFRRALELNPASIDTLCYLALELDAAGNRDEAEHLFASALKSRLHPALVLASRAVVQRRNGELAAAEDSLVQAIQIDPGLTSAHTELANLMLQQKRPEEAIRHLMETIHLDPDQPESHYNLGLLLAEKGDFLPALNHLRAAARLRPDEPDFRFSLGRELTRQSHFSEAVYEFNSVVRLNPRGKLAKLAKEQLAKIDRSL